MGETQAHPLHLSSGAHSAGAERGSFFSDAARREGISMAAYQQPYIQQHDPEMGYGADDKGLIGGDSYGEFMDKQVRRGFIRKVFGILSVQLLITFAIAASLMSVDGAKLYVQQNAWPVSVAAVSLFGSLISLACCGDLHRKFPYNYALLGIFTVSESFFVGVISMQYDTQVVIMALCTTALVVAGLTAYAFQTKYDFTTFGGILFCSLFCLIGFGFMTMFIQNHVMEIMYSSVGALIFSCYLVFDIQLLMHGKRVQLSPDDYVFAALNLYLDIVQLFLHILRLYGEMSRN